jgi:hypothetical protein
LRLFPDESAGEYGFAALVDVHAGVGAEEKFAAVSETALEGPVGKPEQEDGEGVQVESNEEWRPVLGRLLQYCVRE